MGYPYDQPGSLGRPSLILSDEQLTNAILARMPLLPHQLEALLLSSRLAIDVLVRPGAAVPLDEALGVLKLARYWSARGLRVRAFTEPLLLDILANALTPLAAQISAWHRGEGTLFTEGGQA